MILSYDKIVLISIRRACTEKFTVKIFVTLKAAVNDPQGETVKQGLHILGFNGVEKVRIGKYLKIIVSAENEESAFKVAEEMCKKLLANPVIEEYNIEVTKFQQSSSKNKPPIFYENWVVFETKVSACEDSRGCLTLLIFSK